MINNDLELEATKEHVAKFQDWLARFRQTARPAEFEVLAGSYRLEIERMQAEVLDYLVRPISTQAEVQTINR